MHFKICDFCMLPACATAFKQPLKCKRFRFVANALASKHIAPRDNFFSSFEKLKNNIKTNMLFSNNWRCSKRFRFVANALASKHIAPHDNFFSSFERHKNHIKTNMLLLNMLVDAKDFVTFNCPKITEL